MLQNLIIQVLLVGVSFGTGIVSARTLAAAGRGELAAITLWPLFLSGLFALGVPSALIYYSRRFPEDEASLFAAAMSLLGIASIVMVTFGVVAIPRFLHGYDPQTVWAAQIFMFAAPQVLLGTGLTAYLQARGRFSDYNLMRYLPAATTLIALVVLASSHRLTAESGAACYLLPSVPMFFYGMYRVSRLLKPGPPSFLRSLRRISNFGLRAAGIDLLSALSQQVDQVLVIALLSASAMGAYTVALSASRIPNVVFAAASLVIGPNAVPLAAEEKSALIGRAFRLTTMAAAAIALCLAIAIPLFLPRLYGSEFSRSVPVALVLLLELIVSGAAVLIAEAFKACGRPGTVTVLAAASLGLSVALMVLLIPRLGLIGAAIGLLGASSFRLFAMLMLYRGVVGSPLPRLIAGGVDLRFLAKTVQSQFAVRPT